MTIEKYHQASQYLPELTSANLERERSVIWQRRTIVVLTGLGVASLGIGAAIVALAVASLIPTLPALFAIGGIFMLTGSGLLIWDIFVIRNLLNVKKEIRALEDANLDGNEERIAFVMTRNDDQSSNINFLKQISPELFLKILYTFEDDLAGDLTQQQIQVLESFVKEGNFSLVKINSSNLHDDAITKRTSSLKKIYQIYVGLNSEKLDFSEDMKFMSKKEIACFLSVLKQDQYQQTIKAIAVKAATNERFFSYFKKNLATYFAEYLKNLDMQSNEAKENAKDFLIQLSTEQKVTLVTLVLENLNKNSRPVFQFVCQQFTQEEQDNLNEVLCKPDYFKKLEKDDQKIINVIDYCVRLDKPLPEKLARRPEALANYFVQKREYKPLLVDLLLQMNPKRQNTFFSLLKDNNLIVAFYQGYSKTDLKDPIDIHLAKYPEEMATLYDENDFCPVIAFTSLTQENRSIFFAQLKTKEKFPQFINEYFSKNKFADNILKEFAKYPEEFALSYRLNLQDGNRIAFEHYQKVYGLMSKDEQKLFLEKLKTTSKLLDFIATFLSLGKRDETIDAFLLENPEILAQLLNLPWPYVGPKFDFTFFSKLLDSVPVEQSDVLARFLAKAKELNYNDINCLENFLKNYFEGKPNKVFLKCIASYPTELAKVYFLNIKALNEDAILNCFALMSDENRLKFVKEFYKSSEFLPCKPFEIQSFTYGIIDCIMFRENKMRERSEFEEILKTINVFHPGSFVETAWFSLSKIEMLYEFFRVMDKEHQCDLAYKFMITDQNALAKQNALLLAFTVNESYLEEILSSSLRVIKDLLNQFQKNTKEIKFIEFLSKIKAKVEFEHIQKLALNNKPEVAEQINRLELVTFKKYFNQVCLELKDGTNLQSAKTFIAYCNSKFCKNVEIFEIIAFKLQGLATDCGDELCESLKNLIRVIGKDELLKSLYEKETTTTFFSKMTKEQVKFNVNKWTSFMKIAYENQTVETKK